MNRFIYSLAIISAICLSACDDSDDNPIPPVVPETPETPDTEEPEPEPAPFEYNHTPLNDYIVSFAGNTDGLTTIEVLRNAAENFNSQSTSLIGTPLTFLSEMPFYVTQSYSWWTTIVTDYFGIGVQEINDVVIYFRVLSGNIDKAEWESYKAKYNSDYVPLKVTGNFHDGSMLLEEHTYNDYTYSEFKFSLAIEDDIIQPMNE